MARKKSTVKNNLYAVEWAKTAHGDLDEILSYIVARDSMNALKALDKIEVAANSLHQFPKRGRLVPELKYHGVNNYHELLIGPWRLLYRISETEKTAWVVALIDGRRQLEDLLLERFLRT